MALVIVSPALQPLLYDRMTEWLVTNTISKLESDTQPMPWSHVNIIGEGVEALHRINEEMGLALDPSDIDFCMSLFHDKLKRNPTTVELFDISQSNSEHSRHWFFKGRLVIDGEPMERNLMEIVAEPLKRNPTNSKIAFCDNSSAIAGFEVPSLVPLVPGSASRMGYRSSVRDLILTAETHNFPSGVAPYPVCAHHHYHYHRYNSSQLAVWPISMFGIPDTLCMHIAMDSWQHTPATRLLGKGPLSASCR